MEFQVFFCCAVSLQQFVHVLATYKNRNSGLYNFSSLQAAAVAAGALSMMLGAYTFREIHGI